MPITLDTRIQPLIKHLTLEEKIGQLFILGYSGTDIDYATELVRANHIGGFYLSQDNFSSPSEAFQLTKALDFEAHKRRCDAPLMFAIDQEGAWGVLVEDTITGPGNLALGSANNLDSTRKMHAILAEEMRSIGLNTILGPCADINTNPDNPIIGVRAFGSHTLNVAQHTAAAVEGLLEGGVFCSAKHFPGHGDTSEDSHRLLPTVEKNLQQLRKEDLQPFQAAIDSGVPMIMTSHILYPNIDKKNPATLSEKILITLLRREMNFQGLIITDSMNMWAMRNNYDPVDAAVQALKAGADLIMLSEEHYENQRGGYKEKQQTTLRGVIRAVASGQLSESVIDNALTRVLTHKYNNPNFQHPGQLRLDNLKRECNEKIAHSAASSAIQILRNSADVWPLSARPFTLLGASNPASHQRVIETRGIGPNEPYAAFKVFRQKLLDLGADFIDIDYTQWPDMLKSAQLQALPLVIVTDDYPLPGLDHDTEKQAEIVNAAVHKFGHQVVVIALRSHYELEQFPTLSNYICAYSSRAVSADACAEFLVNTQTNLETDRNPLSVSST